MPTATDDDLALLRRETALLWGTDDCGRTEPGPVRVLAVPSDAPAGPPDELRTAVAESAGALELRGCRSFVLPRTPGPVGDDLVGSGDAGDRIAALLPPGPDAGQDGWSAEEWEALTSGRWGPWVAATEPAAAPGRRAVNALCHSPRLFQGAAEAGVWTRPDRRRRGLARRVTAAWAAPAAERCDLLFYSARPDNHPSLATAAALGARPIGGLWQLWPTR